jgi:transcriptional regulator of heat shock response
MVKLTQRQTDILKYIIAYYAEHLYPAISSDVKRHFNLKPETVRYNLQQLQKKGFIDWIREGNRTRALFPLWDK